MTALFYHVGSQRNVAGDNKITRTEPLNDFIIGYIKPRRNLDKFDAMQRRHLERMIGY